MGAQKEGFTSLSSGNTKTHAVYVQDKWQISPEWALTMGGRQEHYEAYDGVNQNTENLARYEDRSRNTFSPKASLSFEPTPAWGFRAAFGKAYRFPTVTELFQQLTTSNNIIVTNNPNLKPEEIYSGEITAERRFANGLARASLFREDRYDALISQINVLPAAEDTSKSYVQNVDHVRIYGIELATEWKNAIIPKLDLVANATLTDSEILKNDAAPSYINKKVPRIPRQLYKAVATYRVSEDFTMSLAARYSGRQFIELNNSDINPETYQGASRLLFVDAKANYKFKDRWTASLGVDNIFNDQAYVYHPLYQRTGYAQIKFDY
jgi:iron complex outermembrane receptor protein